MFGRKKTAAGEQAGIGERVAIAAPPAYAEDTAWQEAIRRELAPLETDSVAPDNVNEKKLREVRAVVALYQRPEALSALADAVLTARESRDNGTPVLIIALAPGQLTEFGGWLQQRAEAGALQGVRLLVSNDPIEIAAELGDKLDAITETNVVTMPVSTEVETKRYKYFFSISPELRRLQAYLSDLATNNISRVYLLGGPGAGKTSLAYYFYLARKQGNFVTVNLASEATGDKAAMKSLLCGHVSGAFPGAGSRVGAFDHARDGVCFIDEAHGVAGAVMEVLMEALDSAQYLPYGATAKRPLDCAIVFASNRNWETLIASLNLDEHARLGAIILHLPDLAIRREDMIAVLAVTLNKMARQCVTWTAPAGLTDEAWEAVKDCAWHGNTRALIRVVETSFVDCASHDVEMIGHDPVKRAMHLWEPAEHASHSIYTQDKASPSGALSG